jgi:hypothetical protein
MVEALMAQFGRLLLLLIAVAGLGGGSTPLAARAGQAAYLTAAGYRVPVYGLSAVRGADGRVSFECVRQDAETIDALRIGRGVSRALWAGSPRVVVQSHGSADTPHATFSITYQDPEGRGFNDPEKGPVRRAALEASVNAWSAVLRGTVPIHVSARMDAPADPESTLLASAGPVELFTVEGRAVPSALASQLMNRRLAVDQADIEVNVNETVNWDYALDGAAAEGKASFVYTMIHEIGHGLGFIDSFNPETGETLNQMPFPFDVFLNRGMDRDDPLLRRPANRVIEDLTSGDLFFNGPQAREASQRSIRPLPMVKLYAPNPYEKGSSVAHVDQDTYADFKTGLMTPRDFGSGSDKIDILTLAIMADMGYRLIPEAKTARRRP